MHKAVLIKKTILVLAIMVQVPLCARILVDKIVARVNGVNILYSTLQQPQLSKDGDTFSLEEAVTQELWVQRAVSRNMEPSDLEVDKQIIAVKEQNELLNISDKEADEALFSMMGINFETYRVQLKRYMAAQRMKAFEMQSRSGVSAHEVQEYYTNHPQTIPAQYKLKIAVLTESQAMQWSAVGKEAQALDWDELEWLLQPDLAAHLQVVTTLQVGEISQPIKTAHGYLVAQVVGKHTARTKTLDERYGEIERMLKQKKIEQYAQDIQKELYQDAVIVRL